MNSLRNAKLEMIDSQILSHPYYWAGFVTSGKADQVVFSGLKKKLWLLGLSLFLAGGIFIAAVKKFHILSRHP